MSGVVMPFPQRTPVLQASPSTSLRTCFDRAELSRILDLYGRMVTAGHWKDYAVGFEREAASFAAFRRASECPEFVIEKRPALRAKQGQWALTGEHGAVLKRGHELGPVLAPVERRLMTLVAE